MFKTAYHHIRRSPYQALAAIIIMVVTFFAVSVFVFLLFASAKATSYIESLPNAIAFFKLDTQQKDIDALQGQLLATGKIKKLTFVSQQEALTKFQHMKQIIDKPILQDLVTADILPPSFEIETNKLEDLPAIADSLTRAPVIENVAFYKDVVPQLLGWTHTIRLLGSALVIMLSIVSVIIMTIIISLKVAQKREEIEIMRLIGATKLYISGPFLLEGIYYGVIGSLLGSGIAIGALLYAQPLVPEAIKSIVFPVPPVFFAELAGAEIGLGIVLGILSSWIAVNRYIK